MSLSEFSVKNFPFTLVMFGLLAALGISSLRSIPRTEDPYFPISAFSVVAIYPGADPLEMERQVTEPIEDALNEIDDVKHLFASADDSLSVVQVEFQSDVDVAKKYDEVTREIASLRPKLPAGVTRLEVKKINPGLVNIVQIALVSDTASYGRLADLAEALEDRLETVAAVREAKTWAYPERELRVALDFRRLAELKLRAADVLNAVSGENTNLPGGPVEVAGRRFNLQTSGSYRSLDEVRNTVIGGSPGRLITVGDVAKVDWDYESLEYTARYNGKRAIWVTANQKDAQNIFVTQEKIEQVIAEFIPTLPADVKLERAFDQSKNVDRRLSRLTLDFALAIALVAITLLPLGLRAAGVVMISIPLSLATGVAALQFAGFSINQLSIAGFVVALGLLVDDSIVVTENIARFLRMGYSRRDAAIQATKQISLAVIGCTATLLFAFLPLLMLPENAGKFIRSLPVAVVFTVLASLLVSLTIIPFLASRLLPVHQHEDGNAFLRATLKLIRKVYAPLLHRALAAPKRTALAAGLLFVVSLALVPAIGFSLFPKAGTPQFLVKITLPDGASLNASDRVLKQVEAELRAEPDVAKTMANLGRGNPQIYYNVFQKELAANYAEVFVELTRYDERRTTAIYDRLRTQFAAIPGAEIVLKEFENGPPIAAPIAIRIVGPGLSELRHLAGEVEAIIASVPGTRDVINPLRRARLDLELAVDPQRAGLLGVRPIDLDQSLRLAVAGLPAGDFRTDSGDNYPVVLRAPMQGRSRLDTLDGLHVGTVNGTQVPLAQLAELKLVESPAGIERYDRARSVTVSAYSGTGYNTDALTRAVIAKLDAYSWPAGYRYDVSGEAESRAESFAGFGAAITITVFGILAVLVLEFGSFKSTLIVATVIPLGVMGGLVALFLSGYSMSFSAIIGFIALIGIEIKNSILLVDFTNQLRREGMALNAAIEQAGEVRFLPILLTSLTAIGGLLPLALQGSGLYSPLAWVIIGGLVSSTLIGRLVTPVMYRLLPPVIEPTESATASLPARA
ncbi:efflux RND transporter permease subunit [Nevskia ramosa]|uniref:efflux RND transporter permease subunit n=1 Tax=Nevskia ramosa TaxID=64002 RepID=UPI0003B4C007|nr:efflux RND transporter permease subunit [Nevskia ramosa]